MAVYHLIYRSIAQFPLSDEQMDGLLLAARQHNQRHAITGILLRGAGEYMQVLEGNEAHVRALYASIEADERHFDVRMLTHGSTQGRIFPRWSMGFLDVEEDVFQRLTGYVEPFRSNVRAAARGPIAAKGYLALLEEFALTQPVLF